MVVLAGTVWSVHHCADFGEVVGLADTFTLTAVGVDMPMGLPQVGPRAADVEARALLGPRRSTLFPTPVASVLAAVDYPDALERSRAACGKGLSKQAFNLLPSIRQVRDAVSPTASDRFFEVHPDTTFAVLAGEPLPSKKSAAGVGRRLQVLAQHCPRLHELLAAAPASCGVDDVIDAIAVTVSARRQTAGRAVRFGSGRDQTGYPLCIVA